MVAVRDGSESHGPCLSLQEDYAAIPGYESPILTLLTERVFEFSWNGVDVVGVVMRARLMDRVLSLTLQEDYAAIATALATRPRALKAAKECVRQAKVPLLL